MNRSERRRREKQRERTRHALKVEVVEQLKIDRDTAMSLLWNRYQEQIAAARAQAV